MLAGGIGAEGQTRLLASTAMVVGCGALGCVALDLLARGGVGTLMAVDRDVVELTNLQRQTLYSEADAREQTPKALAAAHRLRAVNSEIRVKPIVTDATHRTIEALIADHAPSIILDCTDNFQTRFLLNDAAVKHGIPLVYAGVIATRGMQFTVRPGITPCVRCLFEDAPAEGGDTCDTAGVIGPAVAIAASYMAADTLKLLAGVDGLRGGSIVQFDLWANTHRAIAVGSPLPECPCCGLRRFDFLSGTRADTAAVLCGRNAVQIWPPGGTQTNLSRVFDRLSSHGAFIRTPVLVRGTLQDAINEGGEALELTVFSDGRTLVRGTSSIERARAIHARYVGA